MSLVKNLTLRTFASVLVTVALVGCSMTSGGDKSVSEKRATVQEMKSEVLAQLYKKKPQARSQVAGAPGYAVFSNANVNLIFMAAGGGYGVVKNNNTGQDIYMNMAEGGVGIGFGVKDYRIVMVFHTEKAMNDFVNSGWTFGGNADASAKAADKGGSIEGEVYYGDVTVYTFTEAGLALQATVKGTKFWKNDELN